MKNASPTVAGGATAAGSMPIPGAPTVVVMVNAEKFTRAWIALTTAPPRPLPLLSIWKESAH